MVNEQQADGSVPYYPSVIPDDLGKANAEIKRLMEVINMAVRKLQCVEIERSCLGVPEIVRVCDRQAIAILHRGLYGA